MVSTSRKKVLNLLPLAGIRLLFKNWIPSNFHQQEKGYFLKIGFLLISIMVSTSRNKGCKILLCPDETVFFDSNTFFASRNHYWNYVEASFFKKASLLLVETVFLASEKQFFSFVRCSWL